MKPSIGRALIIVSLVAAGSIAGNIAFPSEDTVGKRGDPDEIEFRGDHTFSREDITQELTSDLDFWLKGSSYAPLQDFCDYLNKNIRAGYLRAGFGKAEVSAEPTEKGAISVLIAEGPRYRTGEIIVSGNEGITRDQIVERLITTTRPRSFKYYTTLGQHEKEPEIIWPLDQPAPLDEVSLKSVADAVTSLYRERGYLEAEITPAIELKEDLQVRLRVEIKEGPGCRLGKILIEGAGDKLPEDKLRPLLSPEPGEMVGELEIEEIKYLLWSLGKYLSYEVELVASESGENWKDIKIVLEESEYARSWTEETSEVEAVLWKSRAWFYEAANWQNDLVLSISLAGTVFKKPDLPPVNITLVFSPGRGAYLEVEEWGRIFLTTELLHWSIDHLKIKGCRVLPDLQALFTMTVDPATFQFGLGWKKPRGEGEPILAFQIAIAPASIGKLERRLADWTSLTVANGYLRGETEMATLEINAGSGELHQFSAQSDSTFIKVQTVPGFFEKKLEEFKICGNDYSEVDNILIAAALLLLDKVHRPENDDADRAKEIYLAVHLERIGKLLDLFGTDRGDRETFTIPRPPDNTGQEKGFDMQKFIQALPRVAHLAFLRDSWPWTISRGLALALGGDSREYVNGIFKFHSSEEIGPLGCLAFGTLQKGEQKRFWGAKGLKKLDFDSFLNDFYALFPEGRFPRKFIDWELGVIRCIEEPDLDISSRGLGDGIEGKLLKTFRGRCRDSSEDCLPGLLKTLWDEYLKDKVKTRLEKLIIPDVQNDQETDTSSDAKPASGE